MDFYNELKGAESKSPSAPIDSPVIEKELSASPDASVAITIRNLFTHHDAHPVVLDLALLKTFGVEWFSWDPTTIWTEISRIFKTQISEHTRAKINTVKSLHASNLPWRSWHVFEKIVQGLNNNLPNWEIMQVPSVEQLYVAVDIMSSIKKEEFNHEVKAYVTSSLLHEEITYAPAPLDFVAIELSHAVYHCQDCDSEFSVVDHDGICDSCVAKFRDGGSLSGKPQEEKLDSGLGTNIKVKLLYNPEPIEKRWLELSNLPTSKIEFNETPEDYQVAKLIMSRDYMNIRRKQLADQLTNLKSWLMSDG